MGTKNFNYINTRKADLIIWAIMIYDMPKLAGIHKVQLIFSHDLQLTNKQEIVVTLAQVECIGIRMAPLLECTWDGYIQHVKFWRNEVKRSLGESIAHLELVQLDGKLTLVGLATAPGDSAANQMIMSAQIPDSPLPEEESEAERPILELKPLIDPQLAGIGAEQTGKPSPELALHYERMRGQIVSGVTAYSIHEKSESVLISTATQLIVYRNKNLIPVAQWLPPAATVLNASFCAANPDFIAFTSSGQLYIDKNNSKMFESDSSKSHITNGVGSFVTQEEFERYEAFWWSPTREELLYERVDESPVTQLSFAIPGMRAEEELMHYPLTGTPNAISQLHICALNEASGQFVDLELDGDLRSHVPWMEYIVRMGWTADGNEVFALVMNRLQTQMAILLIPRTLFIASAHQGSGVGQIRTVYEEQSIHWINANNLLRFLPSTNQAEISYVFGSERTDLCHLYLHGQHPTHSIPITVGKDWAVLKEAIPKVDPRRQLVYFLANRHSPILLSLCVSSYSIPAADAAANDCRVLTPTDMSYKFERSCPSLYLNPDVGFVCWLSSVSQLPECRFYRLVHTDGQKLPRSVFTHRIGVQVLPSSFGLNTSTWGMPYLHRNPSNIFSHRFIKYESQNSGKTHFALLLCPANRGDEEAAKFPVIQAVYAGPSIQLVRNSWQTVSQYLKFVSFGYAVVIVDGRGSANRGVQFEASIKERLGSVEIEDQVEGLRVVAEQSGILDMNRVAVIGWSYGGYSSLLLLAEYSHIYRCACVGGAVSDWQLYDTAYTERYMGLPDTNAEEYKQSALASRIGRLPNQEGRLLVVHGMIDENVHFHHTTKLINALVSAQKPHQLLLFPGERHAIRNGEAIEYFHASVLAFFGRALFIPRIVDDEKQPMQK